MDLEDTGLKDVDWIRLVPEKKMVGFVTNVQFT
jgi:hypothetical protein